MTRDVETILGELRDALWHRYGHEPVKLRVTFSNHTKLKSPFPGPHARPTPVPPAPPAADHTVTAAAPFIPTPFQSDILAALEGKALRTDALIAKLDCDRSRLYRRPGGIHELREQGLVGHHTRIGYYSTAAPPPELAGGEPAGGRQPQRGES